jgi:hypothetical protein
MMLGLARATIASEHGDGPARLEARRVPAARGKQAPRVWIVETDPEQEARDDDR